MSKTVFKVGDKVFCILNGHGVVVEVRDNNTFSVRVQFDNDEDGNYCSYTSDGKYYEHITPTLSFTEYTLNGFSQEHSVELPEVGEEIMVSNDGNNWCIKRFIRYNPINTHPVVCELDWTYKYFKRLR